MNECLAQWGRHACVIQWRAAVAAAAARRYLPRTMPRVIAKALLQGTAAPMFTARMVDRKLRWELLRRPTPFPFQMLDKIGQKTFAKEHGADVPATLAVFDADEIVNDRSALRKHLARCPSDFVLKPVHGYQNKHAFAVAGGTRDLLRNEPFDVDAAAEAIGSDGEFASYVVEELLTDECGEGAPSLPPMDYKFWCFGPTIAHVTIMVSRERRGSGYTVAVADCDDSYSPQPTWCACPSSAESGLVEFVQLPKKPRCWDEMVATARRLGEAVGAFARVDFYATPRGPVFGEFQLLFDLVDWNEHADAAIRTMWRGRDGAG